MEQFHLYVLVFAGVMVFAQSASILSNLGGSANGTAFAAYLGYAVALGVVSLCASLGAGEAREEEKEEEKGEGEGAGEGEGVRVR